MKTKTSIQHLTYDESAKRFPKNVFKYRDWDNRYHKRLITHREIYFASPSEFDDPLDCKNPVRMEIVSKRFVRKYWFKKSLEAHPEMNREQRRKWAKDNYKKAPIYNKSRLAEERRKSAEQFDKNLGVLSLTELQNHSPLWDQYANQGHGFNVGFNPHIMFRYLGGGGKVNYETPLPIIYPRPIYDYERQMAMQVFWKEEKWRFEEEYRAMKFNIHGLLPEDRLVILPPEAFTSITIGASMTKENQDALIASIPNELVHVSIHKIDKDGFIRPIKRVA